MTQEDIDKTLIQKTVYFYASDIDKWDAIKKKTQWLHNSLTRTNPIKDEFTTDTGPPEPKISKTQTVPPTTNYTAPEEAA